MVGLYLRGRSVRPIDQSDFAAVVYAGLSNTLAPFNARKLGLESHEVDASTEELLALSEDHFERRVEAVLLNRKIRDANFRLAVCDAYDNRCAVTGLRIVNGGGRSEVQAAHIWSVADGGPDTIQNGIALSATAHWLFDRHLISLTDEYGLLVSHNKVPSDYRSLLEKQAGRIHLPSEMRLWPSLRYITHHRDRFAGN
nr:HNH endonuclease [Mesorhizobium sophorae]